MLSSVPKFKKTVTCLREKMHMLNKLHSGRHYSAAGPELNFNESTHILNNLSLNKNTNNVRLCADQLMKALQAAGAAVQYLLIQCSTGLHITVAENKATCVSPILQMKQ